MGKQPISLSRSVAAAHRSRRLPDVSSAPQPSRTGIRSARAADIAAAHGVLIAYSLREQRQREEFIFSMMISFKKRNDVKFSIDTISLFRFNKKFGLKNAFLIDSRARVRMRDGRRKEMINQKIKTKLQSGSKRPPHFHLFHSTFGTVKEP